MFIKSNNVPIHIMLVEDDEVDVMNVKRAFKKNEIENQLHLSSNGLEAIDLLRSGSIPQPKIILLDINMPKMNGIEFLTEIRKDPDFKSIIVFVMTTSDNDKDRINAYDLNVAGYILKPLNFDNFVSAVKTLKEYLGVIIFN